MNNASAAVAGQMTLVFIVLKLADQIHWDWLWVLSPLWLSFVLTVGWGFVAGFYLGLRGRLKRTAGAGKF